MKSFAKRECDPPWNLCSFSCARGNQSCSVLQTLECVMVSDLLEYAPDNIEPTKLKLGGKILPWLLHTRN